MDAALRCPKCRVALAADHLREATFVDCFGCGTPLRAIAFPALTRPVRETAANTAAAEGESSCFFHASRPAQTACDQCGRFICALCEVEVEAKKLCPTCLTQGRATGGLSQLETTRARWDHRCLLLALVPLLFWPITLVTAPATLFLAFRFWKAPGSLVNPTRWRFVVAGLLALLQVLGWGLLAISLTTDWFQGGVIE